MRDQIARVLLVATVFGGLALYALALFLVASVVVM